MHAHSPPEHGLQQASPRRLRYSLRGLLLTAGVACLVLSNLVAMRELSRLRAENQRLRDRLGELTVADAARLHAIAIPPAEDLRWRWRLHVPETSTYGLYIAARPASVEHDDQTLQEPANRYSAPPGETTLDLQLILDPKGVWRIEGGFADADIRIDLALPRSLAGRTPGLLHPAGAGKTIAVQPGERLLLLEDHDPEAVMFGGAVSNYSLGLQVWIEETPTSGVAGGGA